MAFNWKSFYEVGIHLLDYSDDESYERSAAGRFYYACFNLSKDYFEKKYFKLPTMQVHSNLINQLVNKNDERERELSDLLKNLKWYRVKADYYIHFDNKNIQNSIKNVERIFYLLKDLKENPN